MTVQSFFYKNINILFVEFHAASSWLTAVRLINDVYVAIFGALHPVPHTASTHAGISRHKTKSTDNICSQIILLYEMFSRSMPGKKLIDSQFFVVVVYGAHNPGLVFQVEQK
jgi:hypothetical protein